MALAGVRLVGNHAYQMSCLQCPVVAPVGTALALGQISKLLEKELAKDRNRGASLSRDLSVGPPLSECREE